MKWLFFIAGLIRGANAFAQQPGDLKVIAAHYSADTAFIIPEKDLVPECITYDVKTGIFFVGSIYKRKLIAIGHNGTINDFVTTATDGLHAVLGIKADEKRRWLWALSCNAPFVPTNATVKDTSYTTAIFKYNIDNGKLVKKYVLKDTAVVFNDLTINEDGDAFITNTHSGSIYTVNHAKDYPEEFLPRKSFKEPNGIAVWKNSLFIAHDAGVALIDLATKKIQLIATRGKDFIGGIDGMYFYKGCLIGVQNVTDLKKVIKIHLSDSFNRAEKIDTLYANTAPLDYYLPTTGTIVNGYFYFIFNSQVANFDKNGKIFPMDNLYPVMIMKLKL